MKVIHFFRTFGFVYGLERNILSTLPGLVERGVDVLAFGVTESRTGDAAPEFVRQLKDAGVRWATVETSGRLPFHSARLASEVFRREKPDIIHSRGYKSDLVMLLADTGNAVRMTTIHGWCSRTLRERFYEWINVQCCKRMDRVIVFCQDYVRRLVSRGVPERKVSVVPVGLDRGVVPGQGVDYAKRWGLPADAVVVAQVGRVSREKRPELFVEAARRLSRRFPQARFVLIGEGAMLDELRGRTDNDAITFAGYVSEMADVLKVVDVGVNCSDTEGVPRTLLEAAAAGIPTVATAVGGTPDAVRDGVTGFLCPAGDVDAIEAGIARLIEDEGLRRRMGQAAREHIDTVFGVEACSRHLIELNESLLSDKGAATQ